MLPVGLAGLRPLAAIYLEHHSAKLRAVELVWLQHHVEIISKAELPNVQRFQRWEVQGC